MTIKTAFTQQYSRKISLLSQQTGKRNGKKKIKSRKTTTLKNSKKY